MPTLQQLISFHIIETDKNNQTFLTWTYPSISNSNKSLILHTVSLDLYKTQNFTYFRNKTNWFYITNTDVFEKDKLNNVKVFVLVLITKDFNPDKYEHFGRILSKCYCKSGSPVELVKLYLSVLTTGRCSTQENGTFVLREFDNFNNNNSTKVKELITIFGLEIILLYTAILLKRKVVLYHHSPEILLKWLPSISALMLRRDPNQYLYPLLELTNDTLTDLKKTDFFVAGFKDINICSQTDFFDVLINLPATEISISPHAKEYLVMTKTHKDIALYMVQLAEDVSLSEAQVIKEITNKTDELLNYLKSLDTSGNGAVTIENLKSRNLHPAIENFLFHLAVAEHIMIF